MVHDVEYELEYELAHGWEEYGIQALEVDGSHICDWKKGKKRLKEQLIVVIIVVVNVDTYTTCFNMCLASSSPLA